MINKRKIKEITHGEGKWLHCRHGNTWESCPCDGDHRLQHAYRGCGVPFLRYLVIFYEEGRTYLIKLI